MKTCRKCFAEKSLDNFHRDKDKPDGYRYICKKCAQYVSSEYYKAHKASIDLSCRKWRQANKERRNETGKKWKEANKEKVRLTVKKCKLKNREKYLAASREYSKRNREKGRAWKKANPHKVNANTRLRQVKELKATPAWANQFFIEEIYDLAQRRTKATGYKWHVDHIVPLRSKLVCGLHVEHNLQVIPASANIAKGNKHWPDMPENHYATR